MTDTAAVTQWGEIDGQVITFPMEVQDVDTATMLLTVPADAAQALLPGQDFEVIETDGTAQMVLACCDYHRNPWGDYLEINLGFLARPTGAGDDVVGSFVYRMPVDQAFTCRAGNEVMGFPKTVEASRPTIVTAGSASPGTRTVTWCSPCRSRPVRRPVAAAGRSPPATPTSTGFPTRRPWPWTWAPASSIRAAW